MMTIAHRFLMHKISQSIYTLQFINSTEVEGDEDKENSGKNSIKVQENLSNFFLFLLFLFFIVFVLKLVL